MKTIKYILLRCFVFVVTFSVCQSCQYNPIEKLNDYMGWSDDNIAEEVIEFAIDKETGTDVDLTPRSPESK